MAYTRKGPFVNVPYPDNPPEGAKPVKAEFFNDVEDALVEQGELNATYATNEYVGTVAYGTNLEATDATTATWVNDATTDTGKALRGKFLAVMTPFAFGVVGDGVTDDTAALQAWLDAGGTYRALPEGAYRITAKLTSAEAGRHISGPGKIIADAKDITALAVTGADTRVAGLFVDGLELAAGGIQAEAGGCVIEDNVVVNMGSHTVVSGVMCVGVRAMTNDGVTIRRNTIRNIFAVGDGNTGNGLGMARGVAVRNVNQLPATTPSVVEDNYIDRILGEEGDGITILFELTANDPFLSAQVAVRRNTIRGVDKRYIKIQAADCLIDENRLLYDSNVDVSSFNACIQAYRPANTIIRRNIIDPIPAAAQAIWVGQDGLHPGLQIIDNIITRDDAYSTATIYVEDCTDATIRGNRISGGAVAINLNRTVLVAVIDNILEGGTTTTGINSPASNTSTVIRNNTNMNSARTTFVNNASTGGYSDGNYTVAA